MNIQYPNVQQWPLDGESKRDRSLPTQSHRLTTSYTPLSSKSLCAGSGFGPTIFSVTYDSHARHLCFLNAALGGRHRTCQETLLPSEFWALPRILSSSGFGRLNETVLLKSWRQIHLLPRPETKLIGWATIDRIVCRRGVEIAQFSSRTFTLDGEPLLKAKDLVLLAHESEPPYFREAIAGATSKTLSIEQLGEPSATWKLQLRWDWPPEIWHNNIHTPAYARSLGYKRELIEGPMLADVLYSLSDFSTRPSLEHMFEWWHRGPAYVGEQVMAIQHKNSAQGPEQKEFTICSSESTQGRHRIIVQSRGIEL